MSAAILAAAEKKSFGGMAAQIVLSQQINRILGTHLAPWELEDLPDEWITGLEMWIYDLPKASVWRSQIDVAMARLRNQRKQ